MGPTDQVRLHDTRPLRPGSCRSLEVMPSSARCIPPARWIDCGGQVSWLPGLRMAPRLPGREPSGVMEHRLSGYSCGSSIGLAGGPRTDFPLDPVSGTRHEGGLTDGAAATQAVGGT